jgi:hypothetical protein
MNNNNNKKKKVSLSLGVIVQAEHGDHLPKGYV